MTTPLPKAWTKLNSKLPTASTTETNTPLSWLQTSKPSNKIEEKSPQATENDHKKLLSTVKTMANAVSLLSQYGEIQKKSYEPLRSSLKNDIVPKRAQLHLENETWSLSTKAITDNTKGDDDQQLRSWPLSWQNEDAEDRANTEEFGEAVVQNTAPPISKTPTTSEEPTITEEAAQTIVPPSSEIPTTTPKDLTCKKECIKYYENTRAELDKARFAWGEVQSEHYDFGIVLRDEMVEVGQVFQMSKKLAINNACSQCLLKNYLPVEVCTIDLFAKIKENDGDAEHHHLALIPDDSIIQWVATTTSSPAEPFIIYRSRKCKSKDVNKFTGCLQHVKTGQVVGCSGRSLVANLKEPTKVGEDFEKFHLQFDISLVDKGGKNGLTIKSPSGLDLTYSTLTSFVTADFKKGLRKEEATENLTKATVSVVDEDDYDKNRGVDPCRIVEFFSASITRIAIDYLIISDEIDAVKKAMKKLLPPPVSLIDADFSTQQAVDAVIKQLEDINALLEKWLKLSRGLETSQARMIEALQSTRVQLDAAAALTRFGYLRARVFFSQKKSEDKKANNVGSTLRDNIYSAGLLLAGMLAVGSGTAGIIAKLNESYAMMV